MRVVWLVMRGRYMGAEFMTKEVVAYPERAMAQAHVDMARRRQDAYRGAGRGKAKEALRQWQELDPDARTGRKQFSTVFYGVSGVVFRLHVDQYMEERKELT